MSKQKGFTLIELVLFIVVIAITATAMTTAFQNILAKLPNTNRNTVAIELGQGRMEFILGQRYINGFSNYSDLCMGGSPPAVCLTLPGYTVSSSITGSNPQTVTVTVSGSGSAVITSQVGS